MRDADYDGPNFGIGAKTLAPHSADYVQDEENYCQT